MKKQWHLLIGAIFFLFFSFPLISHTAIQPDIYKNYEIPAYEIQKKNGEFIVYILKENSYQEAGRIPFNKYFMKKSIDLSNYIPKDRSINIMLIQNGGGASHIDSVFLGEKPPINVYDIKDGLKKLSKADFDVIDSYNTPIKLFFDNKTKDYTLHLTARIEETEISKIPFRFPLINTYKPVTDKSVFYTYKLNSKTGTCILDGNIKEVSNWQPFFKEYSFSGTGHPSNYTYGWVYNDNNNLYVAIDFTADNTKDGNKDYAEVHIKTAKGIKNFRVSEEETVWGKPDFTYTKKVNYQHKTYEFKIPLKEVFDKNKNNKEIQIAFSTYGTAGPPPEIYYYEALINSDNNDSTGGTVHVVQKGSSTDVPGVDYIVRAQFIIDSSYNPTKIYINKIETLIYTGGSFQLLSTNDTDYTITPGQSIYGSTAIEFFTSKANLNNPTGQMKIVYHSAKSGVNDNDYTSPFLFQQQQQAIPSMTKWGLAILSILLILTSIYFLRKKKSLYRNLLFISLIIISIATLAWSATITIDGYINDWTDIEPSVIDDKGDSSIDDPTEDILQGFMTSDINNFYFRMDINMK